MLVTLCALIFKNDPFFISKPFFIINIRTYKFLKYRYLFDPFTKQKYKVYTPFVLFAWVHGRSPRFNFELRLHAAHALHFLQFLILDNNSDIMFFACFFFKYYFLPFFACVFFPDFNFFPAFFIFSKDFKFFRTQFFFCIFTLFSGLPIFPELCEIAKK